MSSDLDRELARLQNRPAEPAPASLLVWKIEQFGDASAYAVRLRSIVDAAIRTAMEADFEAEEIGSGELPTWFVAVTDGQLDDPMIPQPSLLGQQRYYEVRNENRWSIQEWLYCFDPELRSWAWWDLSIADDAVTLWIDSRGEPLVACEELHWAVFAAGANSTESLGVLPADSWRKQHA